MSADLAFAALALTDIAVFIRNGPRNQEQLEELNNRCISRLNTLNDAAMASVETPIISDFLEKMEPRSPARDHRKAREAKSDEFIRCVVPSRGDSGELAIDSGLVAAALDLVTPVSEIPSPTASPRSARPFHQAPRLPPIPPAQLSFAGVVPPSPQAPSSDLLSTYEGLGEASTSQVAPQPIHPIFKEENGKVYGNAPGLIVRLRETGIIPLSHGSIMI
ncbi:hypothetical protein DFH09DRAFT_1164241 [Mycena vulgaris]|nr:hypothetical protein DFH09DRAFT_1164241 [Mycena vulgaris]